MIKINKETIKVGVMGCAEIADRYMLSSIKSVKNCELTAVASRTIKKAQMFSEKFFCEPIQGYEVLLERDDINAIYMPLPTGLHEEWIIKSLEAGKHVLAEKSFAKNFTSAKRIVDKAKEKNLLVMEDYMFTYHSQHAFVKKLINEGEIGEIRVFRSCFGFPPLPKNNFRYDPDLGGGALLDAGGYTVKASQLFLGSELMLKGAFLKYCEESEVDVLGGAIFINPKNQVAEVAFGFDNFYQCNYEIWGSTGKITLERAFTPPPNLMPKIILEQQNHKQEYLLPADNHFINIFKEFISSIKNMEFQRHWNDILAQAHLLEQIRAKDRNG